jgi:hypothetical protein
LCQPRQSWASGKKRRTRLVDDALVARLRVVPTETEWFESKGNRYEPQQFGEYLSELANPPCLSRQPRGYLV